MNGIPMKRQGGFRLGRAAMMAILIGLVMSQTACNNKKTRPWKPIPSVSSNGVRYYYEAKSMWAQVRATDPTGEELKEAMEPVMNRMQAAIDNDPVNPLFQSKMGELWLSLGPAYYDKAKPHFDKAFKRNSQWVPAWLGWAELSYLQRDAKGLQRALTGAEESMKTLEDTTLANPRHVELNPFVMMGLMPPQPQQKDETIDYERKLIMGWLADHEQWTLDNSTLLGDITGLQRLTITPMEVANRLRCRIEYYRAALWTIQGAPTDKVIQQLNVALELDADYLPARMSRAKALRELGRYREASRVIRPYVDSNNPMLNRNRKIVGELAAIYGDWYLQDKNQDLIVLAERYYTALHTHHPKDAPSLIDRAALLIRAAPNQSVDERPQIMATARRYLDRAEQAGGDAAAISKWRGQLSQAGGAR